MRSFVFFNGLFYKVLLVSVAVSVAAKSAIGLAIEPIRPGTPLSELSDQFYPYPPGRFAITHVEHRQDAWPDYSEGIFGAISSSLGGFLERFVAYDGMEMVVFILLAALVLGTVSYSTIGKSPKGLRPTYVGLGLVFAAAISNEGEIALFGHATDFVFIEWIGVVNLADGMALTGLVFVLLTSTYQKLTSSREVSSHDDGPHQSVS